MGDITELPQSLREGNGAGRMAEPPVRGYFAGLTAGEIAAALGVTPRPIRRDWQKARMLRFASLQRETH